MSNNNYPDDCRSGQFKWCIRSPDYDDSHERALDAYLEDPDKIEELILANAERLSAEFVSGNSVSNKIVKIAVENQQHDR